MPEPEPVPAPECTTTATSHSSDAFASTSGPEEARRSARQHRQRFLDNSLTGNEVFELLDHFILDTDDAPDKQRKRRKKVGAAPAARHKRAKTSASALAADGRPGGEGTLTLEAESLPDKAGSLSCPTTCTKREPARPRWYNQMYVMFLALRQSPGYTSSRSELVRSAVELDKRISKERGLPKAFTGKTPMNSASALLTNNCDLHFVQFRPPGAKCYHFKLAYDPGDFESARRAYSEWMEVLITKDWPLCFGPEPEPESQSEPVKTLAESLTSTEGREASCLEAVSDLDSCAQVAASHAAPDIPVFEETTVSSKSAIAPAEPPMLSATNSADNIPTCWRDVVEVKPSTIPNAGNGLFAVRDLPPGVPLGFYFGVPMTEDEFDSLKEKVGLASHYSIMYRKTVLDATDESGMPYTDPSGPLYCPFHFMNEDRVGQMYNITFLEGAKVNQIICLTSRAVKAGEELFVSYGDEVDRSHWDSGKDGSGSQGPAGSGCQIPPARPRMMCASLICSPSKRDIVASSELARDSCVAEEGRADLTRLLKGLRTSTAPAEDTPTTNVDATHAHMLPLGNNQGAQCSSLPISKQT
ncbi:hypothetical protein GGI04_000677 [Coemansia thaxteri]|nr:hypothetical protein GGI04_000677 [Coemansia thaxteri]